MEKRKILNVLIISSAILSLVGSACTPPANSNNDRVHINEQECSDFLQATRQGGELYFSGQSKFLRDINEAKLQAFNNAQAAMARAVKSSISSSCQEKTSYFSNEKRTNKSVKQKCKTDVKSENIDVSSISNNRVYCLETKKFSVAGARKTIYRQTARISVSEDRFTDFILTKKTIPYGDGQRPRALPFGRLNVNTLG